MINQVVNFKVTRNIHGDEGKKNVQNKPKRQRAGLEREQFVTPGQGGIQYERDQASPTPCSGPVRCGKASANSIVDLGKGTFDTLEIR